MAEQIHGHMPPALDVEDVLADPAGACPDCVRIVVERLCHDLDVQRAAMATMLADERQMQAAHDRTRAELDAARAEVEQWRATFGETALRDARNILAERDQLQRERDRLAEQVKRARARHTGVCSGACGLDDACECEERDLICGEDNERWPCPTMRDLDGTEAGQ